MLPLNVLSILGLVLSSSLSSMTRVPWEGFFTCKARLLCQTGRSGWVRRQGHLGHLRVVFARLNSAGLDDFIVGGSGILIL